MERQRGDGIGQDADAGVDGGHLHRKAFRHRLTRRRGRSEELGVRQRQVFCGADGAGDLRPNQDTYTARCGSSFKIATTSR